MCSISGGEDQYPSLAAFYADPRRARPREVEYGGLWLDKNTEPPWRVAWLEATGELCAVRMEGPAEGGEVELLGHIATRSDVEVVLRGWPRTQGIAGSMGWVREAVRRSLSQAP